MVQIGTIEYEAKVSNVAQAQANAQELTESQREMGEQARETAAASSFLGTVLGHTAEQEEDVRQEAEQTDEQFTLLAGTTTLLTGAMSRLFTTLAGGSLLAGIGSKLMGFLSGLTISGIVGRIAGAWKWFKGIIVGVFSRLMYYAGAVVGALEFLVAQGGALAAVGYGIAAAIGAVIGLFGVWILKITGVLDWIGKLGQMLGNALPAWARDGILAIIGLFAGPLAVIGSFIVGFIRGGFDKAFKLAGKTIDIFFGAFKRTFNRIAGIVGGVVNWIIVQFGRAWSWVKGGLRGLWSFAVGVFNGFKRAVAGVGRWIIRQFRGAVQFVRGVFARFGRFVGGIFTGIRRSIGQVTNFFERAWRNAKNTVVGFIRTIQRWVDRIMGALQGVINRAQQAASTARNVSPVGGPGGSASNEGAIGWTGFPVNVPFAQSGGRVTETGVAVVHKGEQILPPDVTAAMASGGGGGGGGGVHVDTVNVELSGDFDPSDVSRRQLDELADRLVERIGAKTNRRSGVR